MEFFIIDFYPMRGLMEDKNSNIVFKYKTFNNEKNRVFKIAKTLAKKYKKPVFINKYKEDGVNNKFIYNKKIVE